MNDEPLPELNSPPTQFGIDVSINSKINLADYQNAVPLLRELVVRNDTESPAAHLQLVVTSDPPFIREKIWHIDLLPAQGRCAIQDLDVVIDPGLLSRLTESEVAEIQFTLRPGEMQSEVVAALAKPIELLPRNQWGGISHIPEMVAAFVQPNDQGVERLIKHAAELLRSNGMDPALNGYAGGAKRAWELTASLWAAMTALELDYALPPPSFELQGQKIRTPKHIMDSRLGTCLDLSLLFASALEQMGLNPLLIFTKGHAFCGVWLKPEEFSTAVVDDVTALRKRVSLKELIVFETTLVTSQPRGSFSSAIAAGTRKLSEEQQSGFELAIDIRRSRLQRIKPLAISPQQEGATEPSPTSSVQAPSIEVAPDLPTDESAPEPQDLSALTPEGRLARWQRKLLDLSLRNNLLNFRAGKKALRLEVSDPGALEDLLSDGKELKILHHPDLMEGSDPRSQSIHESRELEDLHRAHAKEALSRLEIFVKLPQEDLDSRMVDLYRGARTALQEGGANTLYLALGFLTWTREDKIGQRLKAPLILIPVELTRSSIRSGFKLRIHEDEPRFNPTLIEMLRQDFRLNLRSLEGELPKDEHGLDVRAIWNQVSIAVKDVRGWEVTEEVYLSTFSFAKYLMWKDLADRADQLRSNPVVRHLIDTPREAYPSEVAFPDARDLDVDMPPDRAFAPLLADSSQLRAISAGSKGKDFVLIGPPGTGKSQTISNLIAQCLAEGKRVLFVSEKIAALDVVYRRLREVGLGEFCLELHSNKARKTDVLLQLQRAWESKGVLDSAVWKAKASRLHQLRSVLNEYVHRLHLRRNNGLSLFEAIGIVASGADVPLLRLQWQSKEGQLTEELDRLRDLVDRLEANASAVGIVPQNEHPLSAIQTSSWSPSWQQGLLQSANECEEACRSLFDLYFEFCRITTIPAVPLGRTARNAIVRIISLFERIQGRNLAFIMDDNAEAILSQLRTGANLVERHRELTASLSPGWSASTREDCRRGVSLLEARSAVLAHLPQPWPQQDHSTASNALGLLERYEKAKTSLSIEYSSQLDLLDIYQLHREWQAASASFWPLSWLKKRRILKSILPYCIGSSIPNLEADFPRLVDLRMTSSKLGELKVGEGIKEIWRKEKTDTPSLRALLYLEKALASTRSPHSWHGSEAEPILQGRCGALASQTYALLTELRGLDDQLSGLGRLQESTEGLWKGIDSNTELLLEALSFQDELALIRTRGGPSQSYSNVAAGNCGSVSKQDLSALVRRAPIEEELSHLSGLHNQTSGLWQDLSTEIEQVRDAVTLHEEFNQARGGYVSRPDMIGACRVAVRSSLLQLVGKAWHSSELGQKSSRLASLIRAMESLLIKLVQAGNLSSSTAEGIAEGDLVDVMKLCNAVKSNEPKLRAWCAWISVRVESEAAGLSPLVQWIEAEGIGHTSVRRVFDVNHARWWANVVVDSDEVLRGFVSAEHEKRIADFKSLDDEVVRLTKQFIRAKLCSELPGLDVPRNSEWGVLRHELSKKKRHLPLRELITQLPTALTKLTPCLLMSPLSIAQYLPTNTTPFDLVVFDEASQIPVWDAVGAIARGRRAVIVGDPKQLPPTSFFDRAESDQDDEDVEGDLESILDECIGANLPTMGLSWHYRSRNESLIAFSNHRYYGGGLVTFPSPVTDDRAVSFHPSAGVYEKGGARINQVEAKALVADIVTTLRQPGFRESNLTIGVVTFNAEQQTLIEDLLDEERRKDPELETYFTEDAIEPIFVKNLESVQGDERDIMYFSITYGPTLTGSISMNFGPMNRAGGERRLNVAVTRARIALKVFSSLRADHIDLSRTQAQGVVDLKHFLDYAERGPKALLEASSRSMGGYDSPFEEAVSSALQTLGWTTHSQIGVSTFRIDLAVVHPDAPGRYLAGVECDGATYHRAATARDRDKLREQVLRGLGWQILRIWSTDWWADRLGTLQRVDEQLKRLLESSRRQSFEAPVQESKAIDLSQILSEPTSSPSSPSNEFHLSQPQANEGLFANYQQAGSSQYAGLTPDVQPRNAALYREVDPASAVQGVDPDLFFSPDYNAVLSRMIASVVEVEGPVLESVLCRRISRAHGWQRTGGRISNRVSLLARARYETSQETVGTFFWPDRSDPNQLTPFRTWTAESDRSVDEVSVRELAWLARDVRRLFVDDESAAAQLARLLGLQRLRQSTRERLLEAIAFSKQFDVL